MDHSSVLTRNNFSLGLQCKSALQTFVVGLRFFFMIIYKNQTISLAISVRTSFHNALQTSLKFRLAKPNKFHSNTINSMNILSVGSVAFDSIQTPFGKVKKTLGGSATFFSLTASNFTKTSVVAVVGKDFTLKDEKVLTKKGIDISGLEKTAGKTFAWSGKYSFDLNSRETLFTHLNVFKNFKPKISAKHTLIPFVFLGNIHPSLQLEVLKQVKSLELVGCDTMNLWIDKEKKELLKVLEAVDVLIINDSEARQLAKEANLLTASKKILRLMKKKPNRIPPVLIVKKGEHGLFMLQEKKFFSLPAYPLEKVLDPTGAGDSFAGGFFGFLAKTKKLSWENFKKAAAYGTITASFSVEQFGTKALENLTTSQIQKRYTQFKNLTHFSK